MKNLMILLVVSCSMLSCKGVGGDSTGSVKNGGGKVDATCATDADCVLSTRTYGCCADCGTSPEEFIAIHVNEKQGRFAKEQADCDKVRKDCPLVNCPVLKFCNDPKAVCTSGKCTAKLVPIPDCTELRYDMPAPTGGE